MRKKLKIIIDVIIYNTKPLQEMNISHTLIILCNIMLVYSLIKPRFSNAYKRFLPEKRNFTLRPPTQTPKIIVQTPLIPEKWNDTDNTTSVRVNVNPTPDLSDSSSRAHLISMLFI